MYKIDYTGKRFNKLTAVRFSYKHKSRGSMWEYLCDCGNTVVTSGYDVKRGKVKSCGCIKGEALKRRVVISCLWCGVEKEIKKSDFEKTKIFEFLKEHMKINVKFERELLEKSRVDELPLSFDLKFTFTPKKIKGALKHRFVRVKSNGEDKLHWETHVHSLGDDVPKGLDNIKSWIENAHELAENWFYNMVEGELLRGFE